MLLIEGDGAGDVVVAIVVVVVVVVVVLSLSIRVSGSRRVICCRFRLRCILVSFVRFALSLSYHIAEVEIDAASRSEREAHEIICLSTAPHTSRAMRTIDN